MAPTEPGVIVPQCGGGPVVEQVKEKESDHAETMKRSLRAQITEDKASFIKKAWQQNVAEV